MRFINVIKTEKPTGNVLSIETFPVHEEQLSNDVLGAAEKHFIEVANLPAPEWEDMALEDGYWETESEMTSLVWS